MTPDSHNLAFLLDSITKGEEVLRTIEATYHFLNATWQAAKDFWLYFDPRPPYFMRVRVMGTVAQTTDSGCLD